MSEFLNVAYAHIKEDIQTQPARQLIKAARDEV